MIREIKKKGFLFILITVICYGLTSCKNDENLIIDYSPVIYDILVVDSNGNNLLENSTPGNILDTEMFIEMNGERYDVIYGHPYEPEGPFPSKTRASLPRWFKPFIASYWYPYPVLPEIGNRLYIGEFPGDARGEIKFVLHLGEKSYEISYKNKKIKGFDIDRRYYLDGKKIKSSSITLIL